MTFDHWLIFIGGFLAGLLVPAVGRFVYAVLDEDDDIDWYDHHYRTGVDVRRRLYGEDHDER